MLLRIFQRFWSCCYAFSIIVSVYGHAARASPCNSSLSKWMLLTLSRYNRYRESAHASVCPGFQDNLDPCPWYRPPQRLNFGTILYN
ncbi:hypothetical protein NPIL_58401 [Nephila pilipes]|uniref:Secreted protein n=1 Tax=Nephila pilipes TaxID=299642 RepID=A0A8X6NL60_NEPPI|nr:hypothetical protein NPIL_58401 [Nephila pilipes]